MKTTTASPTGASFRQCALERTAAPLENNSAGVPGKPAAAPLRHVTRRQHEVLCLLCEGLPNKLIARRLNISPATVKAHIGCILRELGVASRLQAVVTARRLGLMLEPAGTYAQPAQALLDNPTALLRSWDEMAAPQLAVNCSAMSIRKLDTFGPPTL